MIPSNDTTKHTRHKSYKVLIAGICSMIVTVGIARFSYTTMLPTMLTETWLTEYSGGWLATFNYMGYIIGALLSATVSNLAIKEQLYRAFLLVAVATTAAMAWTDSFFIWCALRFLSGLSSSAGLLIASGLILNWLTRHNMRAELGVHFAGLGLGIVVASLMVEVMIHYSLYWDEQWLGYSIAAALFCIPAWFWMPHFKSNIKKPIKNPVPDNPPARAFLIIMLLAYFCAGYGYVTSATFIVDIVENKDALRGHGQIIFLVIGLAATPAPILWDRIARKTGYLKAILLTLVVQVVGVILPAVTDNLFAITLSAVLYGGTFIGTVSLVLTMAGRFYPSKPAKLMGKMTIAYGLAQIISPALTGAMALNSGNYNQGLLVTAAVLCVGCLLIGALVLLENKDAQTQTTKRL